MNRDCGDAGWDSGFGWGVSREDKDLVDVLMLLLEKDLSPRELLKLLGRVWKLYPEVRVVPPGWDDGRE